MVYAIVAAIRRKLPSVESVTCFSVAAALIASKAEAYSSPYPYRFASCSTQERKSWKLCSISPVFSSFSSVFGVSSTDALLFVVGVCTLFSGSLSLSSVKLALVSVDGAETAEPSSAYAYTGAPINPRPTAKAVTAKRSFVIIFFMFIFSFLLFNLKRNAFIFVFRKFIFNRFKMRDRCRISQFLIKLNCFDFLFNALKPCYNTPLLVYSFQL